jgi:hypothetical protein
MPLHRVRPGTERQQVSLQIRAKMLCGTRSFFFSFFNYSKDTVEETVLAQMRSPPTGRGEINGRINTDSEAPEESSQI